MSYQKFLVDNPNNYGKIISSKVSSVDDLSLINAPINVYPLLIFHLCD